MSAKKRATKWVCSKKQTRLDAVHQTLLELAATGVIPKSQATIGKAWEMLTAFWGYRR